MAATVCIAQLNYTVGDIEGNVRKILDAAAHAHAKGAHVLVTPELALTGYPPEDLLLRPAFIKATDEALRRLAQASELYGGMVLVIGHPTGEGSSFKSVSTTQRHNSATVMANGNVLGTYHKQELPNYQVFDERRYFTSGTEPLTFDAGGVRFGLNICEDAWFPGPARAAKEAGAEVLIVINASPYHIGKSGERVEWMRRRVQDTTMPLIFAHQVGGQDEIVFDGASFVLDARGQLAARGPMFEPELLMVQVDAERAHGPMHPELESIAQVYEALKLGVKDYLGKNRFGGAIIGLSGGVDSALVLAIAVDALGADKVRAVMMPSRYTADISWIDARDMANRLGVRYDEIAIEPMFNAFNEALADQFKGLPLDATEENIQARIRGTLLMALSNKTGHIVLTTGNKSEMATGYCTLYGDMAGGFAVIKDVAKTLVYQLCAYRNSILPEYPVIPERILTRAPSAELRPDQKDQDSLPPYDVLDAILQAYMEDNKSITEILAMGYAQEHVDKVVRLLRINEYKRRQAPVGVRLTHRGFGRDWRYPITNAWRDV